MSGVSTLYLERIYHTDQFQETIKKLFLAFSEFTKKNKVDAIAFSGYSGAAVAYILSWKFNIPLICIRKARSSIHHEQVYEGHFQIKNYVIVDDFISSGRTIRRIKKNVELANKGAKLLVIFLYSSHGKRTKYEMTKEDDIKVIEV